MPAAPSDSLVLSFPEARSLVEQHAGHLLPCGEQNVPLLQAGGRVLAEPISADRDVPPFRRATRDGYAVRAADLAALPGRLKIVGEIKAGVMSGAQSAMNSYETFTIMTGAPVPPGADAVVMVEYTSRHGEFVEINRTIAPGENIVPQGAEAKSGSLLLAAGTRLNAPAIALAASVGRSQLKVFSRPRIAVLATGDEIVELDAETGPAQIRNSNSYSLAVQIEEAGGDAVLLPIAPDNPQRLRELIEEGLRCDLLIMTGGVSMGRYDLVEQELLELQAEFLFTGVKIQPGRPAVFGRIAGDATSVSPANKYFFGLPGNPVSTMVTFELLARPALEALCGMTPRPLLFVHARLKADIRTKTGLTRFLPAILSGAYGNAQVELVPWQGSGDIAAQSRANCYIVIPPDREEFLAGEWVAIMLRS